MRKILILTALFSFSFFGIISISKINGQNTTVGSKEENKVSRTVETTDDVNNTTITTVIVSPMKTRFNPIISEHKARIILNIKDKWINSGIILDSNKVYYIVASGLASTSSYKSSLWIGPEGKEHELNGMRMYSVIGKIGFKDSFYIGTGREVHTKSKLPLFLGYNDDMFSDNIGYYIVDIFEGNKEEIENKFEQNEIEIGEYYYE